MKYDTIIIGAGAAGLMCAATASARGRKVLLIDHAKSAGEKIRISGGGRCNFTNIHASPDNYLSQNPRFCISALKRYTQFDFIKLVEKYKIAYHEKTLGQLFCDGSSKQIIDMLLDMCNNAEILLNTSVQDIKKSDKGFIVNDKYHSESLVVATGGLSIPKMGATNFAYNISKQFDINVTPLRAGLVPFTLEEKILNNLKELSGVSLEAVATCCGKQFKEGLLFTHRGLSGPVILQASSYWQDGDIVTINLAPKYNVFTKLQDARANKPKQELQTILATILPKRLAAYIGAENSSKRMADLSNKNLQKISDKINKWQVTPSGTEGYRTAEVTLGGVDTKELSSKTFETSKVKGLYFIGEAVDVTGHLGGFNFQWAWSSAVAAGEFV